MSRPSDETVTVNPRVREAFEQLRLFRDVFDALFVRCLGPKLLPNHREALRAVGLDLDQPLKESYPLRVWVESIRIGSRAHAPTLPEDEALKSLGRAFIDSYKETLGGKAALAMMRLLGPKLALKQIGVSFKSGINKMETRLTNAANGSYELWLSHAVSPSQFINAGILERALELTGAKRVAVVVASHDGVAATYHIRFES